MFRKESCSIVKIFKKRKTINNYCHRMIKFSKWLASFVPIFYLYIYIYVTQQPLSILVPRPNCSSRHYKKKKKKKNYPKNFTLPLQIIKERIRIRPSISPTRRNSCLERNLHEFTRCFDPQAHATHAHTPSSRRGSADPLPPSSS